MDFHNIRGGHGLRIAAEIMVSVLVFLSGEEATQRTAWYVFAGREKHDIATHGNKFNIETNIRNFIASTYIALILILIALAAVSTASAIVEYSPDSDTVILDHFNGTTSAEYVNGPLDYVNGLSGLNTAADFKQGNWIRYALPGWYSWSSIYNPEGKEGTVEMWIYPRKYGLGLLTFQWNRVNSPPGGGYILHFQINSDGKLVGGTWSAISGGPADYTLPSGKTTIPLNTWTHVAFTWGPTGTKLYVNGTIDAENPYNLYPALNSENYVYVNYWGDNDLGYIDELRISKVARTEFPTLSRNISGFKINDTNDNGIWDAGEMGIENWNINLSNATTGALIDSKSTDATGFYNFMNLTPGSYNVNEEMKTGFTATNVTSKTILIENMDVMNVNFTNALIPVIRFNITGFKINDTNGNGKWDAGEAGIQGWNITLTNVTTDAIIASNLTDTNGLYKFMNLANGSYNVTEEIRTGFTPTNATFKLVNITGQNIMNLNFTNQPMIQPVGDAISGYKINDTDGNGKWDAGEKGISNWTIRLIGIMGKGKNAKVIRNETLTDATGFYKFDNLPAGRYFVIEKLKKGFVPTSSPVKRIKLAQGKNSMNNNFTNRPVHSQDLKYDNRDIDDYEAIN